MNTQSAETKQISVKKDDDILQQGVTLVESANSMLAKGIKNDLDLRQAQDSVLVLKAYLDGPGTYHDEEIEVANRLHKLLCGKRNAIRNPVEPLWKRLKDACAGYVDEQIRKAEERRRQEEAEARRKEEEEKARIQRQIDEENRRIQAQKDEEARVQREKDAELKKVRDKKERERLAAEEKERRDREAAEIEKNERLAQIKTETLEEKKESVYVAPKVVAAAAIPQGVSVQYAYDPIVEDKSKIPLHYLIVDIAGIARDQKNRKGELIVPGVRFVRRAVGTVRKVGAGV